VFRAARDLGRYVDLLQLDGQHHRCPLDLHLACVAPIGHHRGDLGVLPRVQDLERKILELPLQLVDAEPMRERRVHLERFLRLLHLLLLAEVFDRAQVVQPVGQLDQDDADVLRHRHDHLPVVLRLRLLTTLERRSGQLRDALDETGDLGAELRPQLIELRLGVLENVVQQRSGDRLLVEMQFRANLRHRPGVVDELLARAARLAAVRALGEVERPADQPPVEIRVVRLHVGDQLGDEPFVMPFRVDDSRTHEVSVLGSLSGKGSAEWAPNVTFSWSSSAASSSVAAFVGSSSSSTEPRVAIVRGGPHSSRRRIAAPDQAARGRASRSSKARNASDS
jgi:hypothetical protein